MNKRALAQGCGCVVAALAGITVGGLLFALGGAYAAGIVMNGSGPATLSEVDNIWTVSARSGAEGGGPSAVALRDAVARCSPSTNGLRILFDHAWYNTMTSGYDAQIWINNKDHYDSYALYISGHHVFVRDEVGRGGYVNRVVDCDLDADGFLALIRP
jgi:hypothetical protein